MKSIILSIHDRHLQNIIYGDKTIDLRTKFPKGIMKRNEKILINFYNTETKMIEVEAICIYDCIEMKGTFNDFTTELKEYFSKVTCVPIKAIENYYKGRNKFSFYSIISYQLLEPIPLPIGKKAPQSFCYTKTIFGDNFDSISRV